MEDLQLLRPSASSDIKMNHLIELKLYVGV